MLGQRITENVRGAINGDEESRRSINLLLQLPFSTIDKVIPLKDEETRYAKVLLAGMKAVENDKDAIAYLRKEGMADLLEKRPKKLAIR